MDEVLKFLPPGRESIPESAFLSRDGRLVYEAAPERLTRKQLTADREELRQLLDEFIAQYGETNDEDD